NPTNGEYHQRLGLILSELGEYETADTALRSGIAHDSINPARYRRYALWLFAMGQREAGLEMMRKTISLEPQATRDDITLMILSGLGDDEIERAMPECAEPQIIFARYLRKTGNDSMAEEAYRRALRYLPKEEHKNTSYFHEVYNFYMKKERHEAALSIMERAKYYFPKDAGVRTAAGSAYEKIGMRDKAIDEYRAALAIDSKEKNAKKRLEILLSE
ncbi:MAG: hypothetical protein AB1442_16070, partial [Nitrospirota bacterium]